MKIKREKIIGTIIPTDLLNLTTEQALDRLAKKYYGTRFRRWVTHLRLRGMQPRQMLDTIWDWGYKKLFPKKAIRQAEALRNAEIARQVEAIRQADAYTEANRKREREYVQELEALNELWREIAPLKSHLIPSPCKKVLRKPSKKSKTKKK